VKHVCTDDGIYGVSNFVDKGKFCVSWKVQRACFCWKTGPANLSFGAAPAKHERKARRPGGLAFVAHAGLTHAMMGFELGWSMGGGSVF